MSTQSSARIVKTFPFISVFGRSGAASVLPGADSSDSDETSSDAPSVVMTVSSDTGSPPHPASGRVRSSARRRLVYLCFICLFFLSDSLVRMPLS